MFRKLLGLGPTIGPLGRTTLRGNRTSSSPDSFVSVVVVYTLPAGTAPLSYQSCAYVDLPMSGLESCFSLPDCTSSQDSILFLGHSTTRRTITLTSWSPTKRSSLRLFSWRSESPLDRIYWSFKTDFTSDSLRVFLLYFRTSNRGTRFVPGPPRCTIKSGTIINYFCYFYFGVIVDGEYLMEVIQFTKLCDN